jgi:hypothetical protein
MLALPSDAVRATAIFKTILSCIALIPLITAFLVFFTTPSLLKSHQNYLFISLLSSVLICLGVGTVNFAYVAIHNEAGILDGIGCIIDGFVCHFCGGMELYSLAALAIERYFAIVKERALSKKQIVYLISFGWIVNIFISL